MACFSQSVVKHNITINFTTPQPIRLDSIAFYHSPADPPHIPTEIIIAILEAAYFDEDSRPDFRLLSNCALVCRDWTEPAQKLLFRHVSLTTQGAVNSFQASVSSRRMGQKHGDSVTRLHIILDFNDPNRIYPQSLIQTIIPCPHLYELDLSLYGTDPRRGVVDHPNALRMFKNAPDFDDETLELLRGGPQISALHFSNWSDNFHCTSQLLSVWPSVKFLTLTGCKTQFPRTHSPPCKLRHLRLNFQVTPSVDFMQWLLHDSKGSLRSLEMDREPPVELLDHIVRDHGQTLGSLAIPTCRSYDYGVSIERCEILREFRIESPWFSPMAVKTLPRTLEHLAFGVDRNTPIHAILQAVKACRKLRLLTVHFWHGGETHAMIPTLVKECAQRRIDIVTTTDITHFRTFMRGDPIPSSFYPLGKSVASMQDMFSASVRASFGRDDGWQGNIPKEHVHR
ncbi:hypothetical protein BD410DRAFT_822193 [Rickenella mellea]|uniref:Uncharacterized protein n=1 Tax=Rickenella mellea TaxID=50990 RepID=A0A4Y7PVK9_9AGAM|nr:hypothetical protein BD410DRAFT_822193 [Rickenella mellea]